MDLGYGFELRSTTTRITGSDCYSRIFFINIFNLFFKVLILFSMNKVTKKWIFLKA